MFTIDLTMACSYLSFSDDGGKSWVTNPLACGMPVNDHQTLFAGPPVDSPTVGYPNVLYYCYSNVVTSSCSKSLDGGITFTPTGAPAFEGIDPSGEHSTQLCGGLTGHGVTDSEGTIYLPRGWCGQPMLAVSHDEGRSWERVQVASLPSNDPQTSVAVDDAGNLYYVWCSDRGLPYLSVSRDGGKRWSRPVLAARADIKEANLVTIDATAPGHVAIAYMATANAKGPPGDRDFTYATWNGYLVSSRDALAARPRFTTGMANPAHDPLFRGSCGPGRCGAVWDFIDVELAPNGLAYAAFVDACTQRCGTTGPPNIGADGLIARMKT